jgi:polar amino acid transport system substrate-binding protein
MRREIAVVGMIACIAVGLLGGWFIPSPLVTTRTPLLDKIIARDELLVGTSPDYPPFENKTFPGGVIIGFDVDLSQMIADEIGSGVTLTMVELDFDALIGACQAGTVDMLAAGLTNTPDRAKQLAPSLTYINVSQVVVVRNDSVAFPGEIASLDDLIGFDVGCQSGTVFQWELGNVSGINVFPYPSADTVVTELIAGNVDAIYVDEPVFAVWATVVAPADAIRVILEVADAPFALWTRHGEPELLYVMNTVIFEGYKPNGSIYDLLDTWGLTK